MSRWRDRTGMYRDLREHGWGRWQSFRVAFGLAAWCWPKDDE